MAVRYVSVLATNMAAIGCRVNGMIEWEFRDRTWCPHDLGVTSSKSCRAAVAEELACSPPIKANRVQSPADSLRIFACRNRALAGGFSRGSPVSPTLSICRCSILTSINLIGSQDLAVRSNLNLFTHSLSHRKSCIPRGNLIPHPLHSGAGPFSPRFTFIGSQELDVKSHPNPFTHFANSRNILLRLSRGAVVAGRLDCSPPTKANWVQSPAVGTPGFSQVGIVPGDAFGRRVFTGISRFPHPCIPALLHCYLISHFSSQDFVCTGRLNFSTKRHIRAGKTGDLRENPVSNGIVRHGSHGGGGGGVEPGSPWWEASMLIVQSPWPQHISLAVLKTKIFSLVKEMLGCLSTQGICGMCSERLNLREIRAVELSAPVVSERVVPTPQYFVQ
ncbi:hypothetical protein PR048_017718 [Dryococelus australis]|uniref:Uncharacterized protein n=1 Tax=Dryococelus australis TaxID=614101 RepID=A0ABQ9HAD1_9NEOP|nr:hypothetical protein PR048_017718 [Dryococelus australis]